MYNYKIDNEIKVGRVGADALRIEIGGKKATILTEDLAALVREELPKDRARDLFAEIEDREISCGKVRVQIKADREIKKGDYAVFTFDINRYLDKVTKKITGVRTNSFGFIY